MQKQQETRLTAEADNLLAQWVFWVSGRPRSVLFVLLGLIAASVFGATTLRIDTDSSKMLSPVLPFQQKTQAINAAFPAIKNTIVIAIRADSADAADAVTKGLTEGLQRNDRIGRAFSPSVDPFLVSHGLLYGSTERLEARLSRLSQASNLLATLRSDQTVAGFVAALDEATALAERAEIDGASLDPLYAEAAAVFAASARGEARPFAWAGALDESAAGPTTRLITVEPALDFTRLNPAKTAMEAVFAEIEALDTGLAGLAEIGVTGDPVLRADELASVTANLAVSLGLSLALVALILWLSLGTAGRVGLALAALVTTLVLTTGAAAATVGALNLISVAFVVLMVGLGIDFAIHVMAHLDEEAGKASKEDLRPMLAGSARAIGAALILSALTTSLAFFAFATTDFVGMAQLGIIGGLGVLIAFAVSVTLIPAAIALMPGLARGRGRLSVPAMPRMVARLGMWLILAAGLASTFLAREARFDADAMGLRNPTAASVETYGWLTADPDLAPLRLSLMTEDPAEALAAAEAVRDLPEVVRASWLGDLVPKDQAEKLDLIDLAYPSILNAVEGDPVALGDTGPATPQTLAERLDRREGDPAAALAMTLRAYRRDGGPEMLLQRNLFRFFPAMIDGLAAQLEADSVTAEDLPAALTERYRTKDGRLRVDIAPAADVTDPASRRAFVSAVTKVLPEVGGPPLQIEGAERTVAGAMALASGLALAATAFLAWLALGRLAQVAAVLIPLALAGAITMAVSVVSGTPFNYANIIVLPLMIGIGVDSGIHLALRTAQDTRAVFDTSTPRAVLASALTTIGAFGTLALSDHPGTASMGFMLAVALGASVVAVFALTPPLVRLSRP
ncbi:MAG: MMPL family transporter [Pseudomonadota bacterium]